MNLVIVESPSKAKTINKYLGKEYEVIASKGHLVDLPKSKLGIDVANDFKPTFIVTNTKVLNEIISKYKQANKLILALDMDREGEAIAWHIVNQLPKKEKIEIQRIVFSEISKKAIEEAINNPREININLVNAQLARRFLDRLVGYTLSPLLWKKLYYGLSAGRVQSAALKLIVERELERDNFRKEEYWGIKATFSTQKLEKNKISVEYIYKDMEDLEENNLDNTRDEETDQNIYYSQKDKNFYFELNILKNSDINKINSKNESEKIINKILNKEWYVKDIKYKDIKKSPKPPFITSTLQQSAINELGYSSKKTMQIAQKLYESGYITYMRTDSTNISAEIINKIRNYIKNEYGDNYLPIKPKIYSTKVKNAQEAHECIRPVDIELKPENLNESEDCIKLYKLIWERTISCQMNEAIYNTKSIIISEQDKVDFQFKINLANLIFEGYLKVFNKNTNNENDIEIQKYVNQFSLNDRVYIDKIQAKQHFTEPPARYSEASLIKKMEELGIGRPSTYSSIISTILERKYVRKEGKYLVPEDIGKIVTKFLQQYFENIVDYQFTAEMENSLDEIANGKINWKEMIKEFFYPFEKQVIEVDKSTSKQDLTTLGESDLLCPLCNSKMIIKIGRYGKFASCIKYPHCKGILPIENNSNNQNINLEIYESSPLTKDGRSYILKFSKNGAFWAHPDFPKVKDTKPLLIKKEYIEQEFGKSPLTEDGRNYILKKGKFGYFWAHPDFPKVKDIKKVSKPVKNK